MLGFKLNLKMKKLPVILLIGVLITNPGALVYSQIQSPALLSPEYFGYIEERISSCFIYPQEAELKGWEGIAKVRFTIARDVRIKDIDVVESSGYPLLDAAAILAIKDASPYPFPQDYVEEEIEVILPVSYKQLSPPRPPIAAEKSLFKPGSFYQPITLIPEEPVPAAEEQKEAPAVHPEETLAIISREIPPPSERSLLPSTPEELTTFIDLAIENNPPTKVAKEEIELAKLKVKESERNVYPSVKVINYYTDGLANTVKYEEAESKFQMEQPVFQSGRIKDTISQARSNLEITQRNYERLKLDVVQKVETAYYNLVAAKMHLIKKQAVIQEAKDILEKVERLAKVGMVIPLEVNSSRAWVKQIEFQAKGVQQDLFMAELTFKQVLNVKETPRVEAQLLEARELGLNLDDCLQVAFENRPELYLSELLVKFNDYGKKIEIDKG